MKRTYLLSNSSFAHPSAESLPEVVSFGPEICSNLAQAENLEWWLANGLGAYAGGTVAGSLTRCYHGLLIAPIHPPLGRMLLVTKVDATFVDATGREWPLFTNRWSSGAIAPAGYPYLESFRLDGRMPVWQFRCGENRIEMRVWMEAGKKSTYVAYRLLSAASAPVGKAHLKARLLTNFRDHHGRVDVQSFIPRVELDDQGLKISCPGDVVVYVKTSEGVIQPDHAWYEGFDLPKEHERGLNDQDKHFSPGEVIFEMPTGQWKSCLFTLHEDAKPDAAVSLARFRARDVAVLARAHKKSHEMKQAPDWIQQLLLAADCFLISRSLPSMPNGESIIAGYPWFGDWGRDAMISLTGLTLATGRHESALQILETFARFVDQGMLPNVFSEDGENPEYNTADAALWYIEAWRAYVQAAGDLDSLRKVFPVLESVIRCYRDGTRYNIHMDPTDGLIDAGETGMPLTWMDAKVGNTVFTPRTGKAVEINALWHNALCAMAELAELLGRPSVEYHSLSELVCLGFQRFVRPDGLGLFDVLDGPQGNDVSIRPNQILAVSLHHSPLKHYEQQQVVAVCQERLLCKYGLRSLDPEDAQYRQQYQGGVWERDSAYHQGTVWGWLLGHFALAYYRAIQDVQQAQEWLSGISDHLCEAGLGTISEIFDGDAPHHPRGCPAQAWSVACALEAWWKLEKLKQ